MTCEHAGLEVAGVAQGGGGPRAGELEAGRGPEHHGGAGAGAGVWAGVPGVPGGGGLVSRQEGLVTRETRQLTGETPQLSVQPTLLAAASTLSI